MRFKKTFEIEYDADDENWMNVWNLEIVLRSYAPGGVPYTIREVTGHKCKNCGRVFTPVNFREQELSWCPTCLGELDSVQDGEERH